MKHSLFTSPFVTDLFRELAIGLGIQYFSKRTEGKDEKGASPAIAIDYKGMAAAAMPRLEPKPLKNVTRRLNAKGPRKSPLREEYERALGKYVEGAVSPLEYKEQFEKAIEALNVLMKIDDDEVVESILEAAVAHPFAFVEAIWGKVVDPTNLAKADRILDRGLTAGEDLVRRLEKLF